MRQWAGVGAAAGVAALVCSWAWGQAVEGPQGIEDLKALYDEASLLVQFQVESAQANPMVDTRLVWEVRGPLVEAIKGSLGPGPISVHVPSIVRVFGTPREEMPGQQFVAGVKPLGEAGERRFELVGHRAFAAEGDEAKALRQLAQAVSDRSGGGEGLRLQTRALEQPFAVHGAKRIEVRLTNEGDESATYLQEPLTERDGRLYLMGDGMIRLRDINGRLVSDKGNVVVGEAPPPPPTPALILPNANHDKTIDLDQYFDLGPGRYTLTLALASPTGRGRVAAHGLSLQVGAVNLPEREAGVDLAEAPIVIVGEEAAPLETAEVRPGVSAGPPPERGVEKAAVKVPDPSAYQPGRAVLGLAGLLRPTKARYEVGDPVEVELLFVNMSPRTLVLDTRLERTVTVQVQPVGDSPRPLLVRQLIPWPNDERFVPETRAYLRDGAFWGSTVNLNSLHGRDLETLASPTAEQIASGKDLTYEQYARNLFGFPEPGVYKVTATCHVNRLPKPADDGDPSSKIWWNGSLETNSIVIEIVSKPEPGRR